MFRRLSLGERKASRETLNNNSLFLTLYTPLWRRRGEDLSPEEVWVEGNRLAVLLREESNVDSQIRIEQAFDDLCSTYEVFVCEDNSQEKRNRQKATHSAMMVTLTAFLLLLNVYDKVENHPYKEVLVHLKSAIWDIPDCRQLYEEIRDSEDEREKKGKFIEVADFIEEITAQEDPLSQKQIEFACKRMEEFVEENKFCDLKTRLDNERIISRISDRNNHCFQKQLDSMREYNNTNSESQSDELSDELLARGIENCQDYFWGNSAYGVVYCVCRDDYKMPSNKSAFEERVEKLPYKKKRSFTCTKGTIANAFSNNQIYAECVDDWESYNPLPRIIKLRDELRKELKL